MLFALKKIQAKTVNPNVTNILKNSFEFGRCLPCPTTPKFFLFFWLKVTARSRLRLIIPMQ